jgi:hypothetical protein
MYPNGVNIPYGYPPFALHETESIIKYVRGCFDMMTYGGMPVAYENNFYTDNKIRLPVCIDKRTTVYERAQKYNIYHFSLEHNDDTKNYGIYANGLLVESCSIKICDIFSKL